MNTLNVLIIGGGGREHALAWAISRSEYLGNLYIAPGNAGTLLLAESLDLDITDHQKVIDAAEQHSIDLVVIGPEQPLVDGLADDMRRAGYAVFGPDKAAAQLEGSKAFAKSVMYEAGVPTAEWRDFNRNQISEARAYALEQSLPVVVKADGLASGKGVVICRSADEVETIFDQIQNEGAFGEAASRIVVEEFMEGDEASVFAVTDGDNVKLFPPAQDHKQIGEGGTGPNTGGMGAYIPAPMVDDELLNEIEATIIRPVLKQMKKRGTPYKGVLYTGLMITSEGPKVVEFNCRFGDPECQVLMPAAFEDVLMLFYNSAAGQLEDGRVACSDLHFCGVIMASTGYPGSYEKGKVITGTDRVDKDVLVYHSATKNQNGNLVTSGGRVLCVVGRGETLEKAIQRSYAGVREIDFEGAYYRSDIGRKGLMREAKA